MAKRNQYNMPGSFNQVSQLTFRGGATFNSGLTVPVSGTLGAGIASTTIAAAVTVGDIIQNITQSGPVGTLNFVSVTLAVSESFSIVLKNNHIRSSSLGSSTIILTTQNGPTGFFPATALPTRAILSASSGSIAKIAVASSNQVLAANSLAVNYMIVGGND